MGSGFWGGFFFGIVAWPKIQKPKSNCSHFIELFVCDGRNRAQGAGSAEPVPFLEGLVKARSRVELSYYQMMDNLLDFSRLWAVGGGVMLCGGVGGWFLIGKSTLF